MESASLPLSWRWDAWHGTRSAQVRGFVRLLAARVAGSGPGGSPDLLQARHHRRVGAIQAAVTVARRFGLLVERPVVLSVSNNVVVWLAPSLVVAKVGTGHHRRLAHELAVAEHLTAVGAPVVPLTDEVPHEVHRRGVFAVTFWEYHPRREQKIDPARLGRALSELHEGLASYGGELVSYRSELERCGNCWPSHGRSGRWATATGDCWHANSTRCRSRWGIASSTTGCSTARRTTQT